MERSATSLEDPKADKRKFFGGLGAIVIRALRQGDVETATIGVVNVGVSVLRDRAMHRSRQLAVEYHLSEDAISINKHKTQLHAGASVILASPLSQNKSVRRVSLALLSAGTLLGLVGHHVYHKQLKSQIQELSNSSEQD